MNRLKTLLIAFTIFMSCIFLQTYHCLAQVNCNQASLESNGTVDIQGPCTISFANVDIDGNITISVGPVTINDTSGNDIDIDNGGTLTINAGVVVNFNQDVDMNNGGTMNVSGTVTGADDLTVDAGATLNILSGGTFNVGTGGNNDMSVSGTVNVSGILNVLDDATVNSGGLIDIMSGGEVDVTDNITNIGTIEVSGVLENDGGGDDFSNTGVLTINSGGYADLNTIRVPNGTINVNAGLTSDVPPSGLAVATEIRLGGGGDPPGTLNVSAGADVNVAGDINLGPDFSGNDGVINLGGNLTVGGTLDINNSDSFLLSSGSEWSLNLTNDISFEAGSNQPTNAPGFENCEGGVACGPGPLPVELTHFSVSFKNDCGLLTWTTASEIINEGFNIEKSADGENWTTLGFVTGHGTTNEEQRYKFEDFNVSQSSYYRLKQMDYDGVFEYSPIVFLSILEGQLDSPISVYPNPTNGQVILNGLLNEVYSVSAYDLLGRSVLPVDQLNLIDAQRALNEILPNLKSGSYVLKFQNPGYNFTTRLIKH